MHASWTRTWIAAGLFAAAAQGETLFQQDGITLEGTVRIAARGAAVCKVLATHHPPEVYERMKENHGQPLHVWRLDYTARNGSGRRLEHLTANLSIASEWPPCTTWSGPVGNYPKNVQWANSFEVLQTQNMESDEEIADTVFVLTFHDQKPEFDRWSVDYRFAAGAASDSGESRQGGGVAGRESETAAAAAGLPPEIQVDMNLRKAEHALRKGDVAAAREAMKRLAALEAEHGLEPLPEDHYRYAQAWAAAGETQRAMAAAVRYLQAGGRDAEHYTEALDLINREGSLEAAPAVAGRVRPGVQPQPGESRVFDGIEFVWMPAGEFLMGAKSSEAILGGRPLTRVRISRGFYLGKHEVTQAEWQAVMGSNPSECYDCGSDYPVEKVSWDDVQEFIAKLNATVGQERYRLPTEAEWEYAARAGTNLDRYGNLDAIAWYGKNSGRRPHPVGQKAPNAWGLYDMLGNVAEVTHDYWYGAYPGGEVTDPRGPVSGSSRVVRGGSWLGYADHCRASYRESTTPDFRAPFYGFRLLRTE